MRGEETQKAMTAGKGTPTTSKAATRGTTPQEQNGESAPMRAASRIAAAGARAPTRPTNRSTPAAFSQAARSTESSRNGAIQRKLFVMNSTLSPACPGSASARIASSAASASHTRSSLLMRDKSAVSQAENPEGAGPPGRGADPVDAEATPPLETGPSSDVESRLVIAVYTQSCPASYNSKFPELSNTFDKKKPFSRPPARTQARRRRGSILPSDKPPRCP